ncbi:MAG: hypothetical protein IT198_10210 [Acidimicrobiia bacterium]|nr:hypothetical protein [Acidimicrobiia bacterium]
MTNPRISIQQRTAGEGWMRTRVLRARSTALVVLLALVLVAGACGGSGDTGDTGDSGKAQATETDEPADGSAAAVDEDVKEDISACVLDGIEDPAVRAALDEGDVASLTDAQIQVLIGAVGACSANGLGLDGAAAACLQKAFAAAASRYPDVRALAAEIVANGDTTQLEQSVMQAAMSPSVCTTEERQAMLAGSGVSESG